MAEANGNGVVKTSEDVVLPDGMVPADQLRQAEELRTASAALIQRIQFARQAGLTFNGDRDLERVLGYAANLSSADYYRRYLRGGIAGRIVDAPCNATWRGTVEVIEDRDPKKQTKFEKDWLSLDRRLQAQAKLLRVDKLSQLSNYAVLLIGARGLLNEELPKGNGPDGVLYLAAYGGAGGPLISAKGHQAISDVADVSILEYETDSQNPRFGMPKLYQLRKSDLIGPGVTGEMRTVHWTRVIHIAENCLFDDIFGLPALERVWNLLDDLDKVTGGGAEAFWLRANQGLHLDIAKDMHLDDQKAAVDALKEQADAYKHQLTRWLRTRGVSVETLGSDVANFASPADAVLTQISGAKAIPKRILTGSEMGELASSQDRDNWKDQVNGRQTQYAGPYIMRPLVDRLIEYGYLTKPNGEGMSYEIVWPHIEVMTESEKAAGAAQWAAVNSTQGTPVFTDAEIRDHWYRKDPLDPKEIDAQIELKKKAQAPPPPAEAPSSKGEELLAAAEAKMLALSDDEKELLTVLELAIDCGNYAVVEKILGPAVKDGH